MGLLILTSLLLCCSGLRLTEALTLADKPIGFAEGTTGGQGGETVTVTTVEELKKAIEKPGKRIILVSGTIYGGVNGTKLVPKSDKSVIGDPTSGGSLEGIGFHLYGVQNVIFQNLKMTLSTHRYLKTQPVGNDHCIVMNSGILLWIERSQKVWIDHCDLFNEYPAVGMRSPYHVLVGISHGSQDMTFSWNRFHEMGRNILIGSDDNENTDWRITIHHNFIEHTQERNPLMRGGTGHFFNNYLKNISYYGVNTVNGGCMRVEKNVFEDVNGAVVGNHPSIRLPGAIENLQNRFSGGIFHQGFIGYPDSCHLDIKYEFEAADAEKAKQEVLAKAGTVSTSEESQPEAFNLKLQD